jgi:glycosyltransferase involved in cell wall biosynthesis
MPKVTIIVPVYNVELYLKECLDSLICQSLSDIEIICVDDGSTDNSPTILSEYSSADNRISIVTKENGGLSSARNAGVNVAKGEYIYFLDSDDRISRETIEYSYNIAKMNELDLLLFDGDSFYESETLRDQYPSYETYYNRTHDYNGVFRGGGIYFQ